MMGRVGRGIEILLGIFFLVSAATKVVNLEGFAVQISLYGVIKDPTLVLAAAYVTVSLEALLGAAFIAAYRIQGLFYGVATAMTIVFSGLIAYAWAYKGLEDCGCFGDALKMTPAQSLWKNLALLVVLGVGWYGTKSLPRLPVSRSPRSSLPIAAAILGLTLVTGLGLWNNPGSEGTGTSTVPPAEIDKSRPFQRFQFSYGDREYNLGEGRYLVAMLNATCEHCIASVPDLNVLALSPDLPELVALMMADSGDEEAQLRQFRLETQPEFPTQLIGMLDFVEFIESAPPRLIYVKDGIEIHGWDWDEHAPGVDEVQTVTEP
ncbi:MAG: hypothetical protein IID08_01370 [Candidatus Hydrogenedentes bacterium]|nr:hypothetical protein [Candidatus Hydrogenedentota bacterium]